VEADLAFKGIDLRDLWRRGSGLTYRRLLVLLRAMPDDPLWRLELRAEVEAAKKPKPDLIRDRQAAWEARNRRAREVSDG
jgi:hypothetical protein